GFNRVLQTGANFTSGRYTHATTTTGPGHSTIGTGYLPARSGIIANTWFDRASGTTEYCVADEHSRPPFSPVNLACDSLGDKLQQRYPGSKVYAIALKDRAAILMGGRGATAAYWFDTANSTFTSSTYYHGNKALLDAYNATLPQLLASHPLWEQSTYIPAPDLERLTHDPEDLRKYKTLKEGLGVSFPHRIRTLEALTHTPFGNEMPIALAQRVIEEESLGTADGSPDLVFIGLSSPDYLGHLFGPDSLEVADTVVRTDRDLASFFGWLDERFAGRVTVAISADHGVQSIPEVARALGRDAGRVDLRNPNATARTWSDLAPERRELEVHLARELGLPASASTPVENGLVLFFEEPSIYLNWVRIRQLHLDGERVKRLVKAALKNMRGVSGAFTNSELMMLNRDPSDLEMAVRQSFRADRSGDVLVTLKPGYIWSSSETGTSHGQPIDADQHVPLMFWGAGITAGTYDQPASPVSIAKTLGALVGVDAGSPSSEQLPCVAVRSNARYRAF
ncbi:MAG: alkaline phosphatase family protein, partial [Thermoanaerobaculia bacterium]